MGYIDLACYCDVWRGWDNSEWDNEFCAADTWPLSGGIMKLLYSNYYCAVIAYLGSGEVKNRIFGGWVRVALDFTVRAERRC
jgi:hypothetical protein